MGDDLVVLAEVGEDRYRTSDARLGLAGRTWHERALANTLELKQPSEPHTHTHTMVSHTYTQSTTDKSARSAIRQAGPRRIQELPKLGKAKQPQSAQDPRDTHDLSHAREAESAGISAIARHLIQDR